MFSQTSSLFSLLSLKRKTWKKFSLVWVLTTTDARQLYAAQWYSKAILFVTCFSSRMSWLQLLVMRDKRKGKEKGKGIHLFRFRRMCRTHDGGCELCSFGVSFGIVNLVYSVLYCVGWETSVHCLGNIK